MYLYLGSGDVGSDLGLWRDKLEGQVVWHHRSTGTEVAAVRVGDGPLVLLADHRPPGTLIQIWEVDDLERAVAELEARGYQGPVTQVEVPDGPCALLRDASGNEIGLLHRTRPGAMEG